MTILFISKDENLYSSRRFLTAGRKAGVDIRYVNPLELSIFLDCCKRYGLYHKNKPIERPSAVINRFGTRGYPFGHILSCYCEIFNIPVINPFNAVLYGKNKILSLNLAKESGLPLPATYIPEYAADLSDCLEDKLRPPYIIKLQSGSQGIGVMLAKDMQTLQAIADYLWDRNEIFIIQNYYDETEKEFDIRLLFFDVDFLGAFAKRPAGHDFRSNFHRGGEVLPYTPDADLISKARKMLYVSGLRFAGIDFLITREGKSIFLEINESPGFEAFEKINGRNVAEKVISKLLRDLDKPSVEKESTTTADY